MLKRYIAFAIDTKIDRVSSKVVAVAKPYDPATVPGGWDDSFGVPTYSSDSLKEIEGCLRAYLSGKRDLMRVQIVDLHNGRIAKEFMG